MGMWSYGEGVGDSFTRTHWLDVFTPQTWSEFVAAGADVSGFRPGSSRLAAQLRVGDWLICYVVRVSRFVAVLEVTSEPYVDFTPIWSQEAFPHRVRVRPLVLVDLPVGVDIHELVPHFSWYEGARSPQSWQGHVQNTLRRWRADDAHLVLNSLRQSVSEPHPSAPYRHAPARPAGKHVGGQMARVKPREET